MKKYKPLPLTDVTLNRELNNVSICINDIIDSVDLVTPVDVVAGTNISVVESPANTYTVSATGLVVANTAITGATKTKITYDSKGLVTAGTDATTTDITEGINLYFTDARARTAVIAQVITNGVTDRSPSEDAVYDALVLKLDANVAITGATKTKITYDADGLVTAGVDATTADIADSTNKRYVTDADLTSLASLGSVTTYQRSFLMMGA